MRQDATKGVCGAFMAYCCEKNGSGRNIWLFDSFEGLSVPSEEDREAPEKSKSEIQAGNFRADPNDVKEALTAIGIIVQRQLLFPNRIASPPNREQADLAASLLRSQTSAKQ